METVLKIMQSTVKKYARVLSKILKVDVEIVDEQLNRIAGTGMFSERVNRSMENEGYVYKEVIRTGKMRIIKEPGKHKICRQCPKLIKQGYCEETFEMSMPIKIGRKVIGVIGFVCFDKKQKKHILDNFKTFSEFLEQISDLISSKAKEEIEKKSMISLIKMLNGIIDKVEQGVLILDDENTIVKVNSTAKAILKMDQKKSKANLVFTDNSVFGMKEYRLNFKGNSYLLIGEEYRILKSDLRYNRVFIFNDINTLKQKMINVTTTQENVGLDDIIGESKSIKKLKQKVIKIAPSSSTVLITGESGTGKELFARAIHIESDRRNNPFVAINCAAIPDTLLESELFGYVKGAFTGADPKGKIGKIEFANKGTLFLDEIGDMPLYLQSKLLRVLEQKEITRLGSNKPVSVDVRVIAATNKNLEEMIKQRAFREDLYYRLNVLPFIIPPLRERKEDIKTLMDYFINKYSVLFEKKVIGFESKVMEKLLSYSWPGNVRELENTVEYMINMMDNAGIINTKLLPVKILKQEKENNLMKLEELEKSMIERALNIYGTSVKAKQKAAQALGIGIATLYRKIKKYGLE